MISQGPILTVDRVDVRPDRIEAVVRVPSERHMRTSSVPGLAEQLLRVLPGIARHRCECGSSHGIEAELADTEVPHLLEHVALELMVLSGSPRTLRGDTRWDFKSDGRGVFRVALEYDDDLVSLGALKEGARIVENVMGDSESAALESMVSDAVARLAKLRTVET